MLSARPFANMTNKVDDGPPPPLYTVVDSMTPNNKLPPISTVSSSQSKEAEAERYTNWTSNHSEAYPAPTVYLGPVSGAGDHQIAFAEARQEIPDPEEVGIRRRVTHCLVFGVMLLLGVIVIFLTKGLQASLTSTSMMRRMNGIGGAGGGVPGFTG